MHQRQLIRFEEFDEHLFYSYPEDIGRLRQIQQATHIPTGNTFHMSIARALLKASHFGPTLLVTAIGALISSTYYSFETIPIATAIFSGQLIVGWSNDLIDYRDDLAHNRTNKPLVANQISYTALQRALLILIPISFLATITSPLGIKG